MRRRGRVALATLVAIGLAAAVAAGCGDSDDGESGAGNATDAAFVNDMVPHHEGAIQMAKVAQRRAEHPEIERLADTIRDAQEREITLMGVVRRDLEHMSSNGHMSGGHMGLDERAMGMDMDMPMLERVRPFDRAFIDMMIPHHLGAVRMARLELKSGRNATLRKLAQDIIDAQNREIAQMRGWRAQWYGSSGSQRGGYGNGPHHGSDSTMHGEE